MMDHWINMMQRLMYLHAMVMCKLMPSGQLLNLYSTYVLTKSLHRSKHKGKSSGHIPNRAFSIGITALVISMSKSSLEYDTAAKDLSCSVRG